MRVSQRAMTIWVRPLMIVMVSSYCLVSHSTAESDFNVRILRDTWGVPHLFGKTDADAAYGLGYVHAEDDWTNTQSFVLSARGTTAAAGGPRYLNLDFLHRLFRIRHFVDTKYERELSAEVREVVEAYAAGITAFAQQHPEKFSAVDLPVTGQDVVAGISFKTPFFYLLERDLAVFLAKATNVPNSGQGILSKRIEDEEVGNPQWWKREVVGSNAWAVSPSRSSDGATRLAINSHIPWSGPVSYYEAHLHSDAGWNMNGNTMVGSPFVLMGHDQYKGWCHTINKPDLADIYALEVNPEDENQYRFDGDWHELERSTETFPVMGADGTSSSVSYELLWSLHGPVVRRSDGLFALRFAGYGEFRQLDQVYRMNKAHTLEEFKSALAMMAMPSLNTIYADKAGNVLFFYGGKIPVRAPGFDWSGTVPGNTSKTLWQQFYPMDRLPQILNPESGFVQNCNSSPFNASFGHDNPAPDAFPGEMGIERHETNRSRRAQALYGSNENISREQFREYKYDTTCSPKSDIVRYVNSLLEAETPEDDLLREALELLKLWDRSLDRRNTSAALAVLVGWPHNKRSIWAGTPPNPMKVLQNAAALLKEHHGRLDVPLEDVLRMRYGNVDIALDGGPDVLRAIYADVSDDGRLVGNSGDCYLQFVEWDKDGNLHSEAVQTFGSAPADTASPHYADQAPLFAGHQLRPVLMTEAEVQKNLQRAYRPGDFTGPWYAE